MTEFREHIVRLMLDKTLYKGFIRLQADKGLGRSFAGLLPFVEGLYSMGYLSKEDYESHRTRYSQGLDEEPKPLTKEQISNNRETREMETKFRMVLEQWSLPRGNMEKWRSGWIQEAEKWKDKIPNANLILDLARKEEH